jgi:dTMP kinase
VEQPIPFRGRRHYSGAASERRATGSRGVFAISDEQDAPRASPSREGLTVDAMVGGGRRVSAYGTLMRNKGYRLWFSTAFFAGVADWTGLFALQVLVVTLTAPGSRLKLFALGGIMMARLLPSLVLGPVAGVLADRYDRKRLMVFTNIVRAVIYVALATADSLVTLFALVLIVESLSLLYLSSKDASLPVIVRRDHLTQANQLNLLVTYAVSDVIRGGRFGIRYRSDISYTVGVRPSFECIVNWY